MATEKPWVWFVAPQEDRDYLALATYLPVGRWRAMPSFGRYTVGSIRQLSQSAGLLGYSLRAAPMRRDYWTLTVWADAGAVAAYVRAQPHRDAMRWLRSSGMGDFRAVRWSVPGGAMPPSWPTALARLAE